MPNNDEASLRQLGKGETQEMKTKSQTLVYDYDEIARSGSSLTLMKCSDNSIQRQRQHFDTYSASSSESPRERRGRHQCHIENLDLLPIQLTISLSESKQSIALQ